MAERAAADPGGPGQPVPLNWPDYGISFGQAIRRAYRKWAVVDGRAGPAEYWWFGLFVIGVTFGLGGLDYLIHGGEGDGGFLSAAAAVFLLVNIVPSITLTIRRLHDTGRSGWFSLCTFIPFAGSLIMLILLCGGTRREAERFGPPYYSWTPAVTPPAAPAAPTAPTQPAWASTSPAPAAADTGPASPTPRRSMPPRKTRGPVVAIAAIIAVVLIGTVAITVPIVRAYQTYRAGIEIGDTNGVGTTDDPGGNDPTTAPASVEATAPDPTSPTSDPTTPSPEPSNSLGPPTRSSSTGRAVRNGSAGTACRTATAGRTWGYPTATCRLWKSATGISTGESLSTGRHPIACQRDLAVDNPVYTKNQTNTWWVWAQSDGGIWDWFPETAIAEGASDQAVNGVALC